ncbi:hypothetical protein K469DRAFT_687011 [Zopfia rhizophila CBS 207.26]|uniref:Uncharacterized protein n=1 Tax=Zopfia rhizophila CBS 207.26 TaxID=1314779 RepID=A0A6A6E499_9PEZI|nr:hypothetical protein K469DRAFT_687011 [Zopfia rhizophila CBS 207.26]
MLMIGGIDPWQGQGGSDPSNTHEPGVQGIEVLNMTSLDFNSWHNADASPYVAPAIVQALYKFRSSNSPNSSEIPSQSSHSPSQDNISNGLSTGGKVAIVVAVLVVVLLVLLIAFLIWRKRRGTGVLRLKSRNSIRSGCSGTEKGNAMEMHDQNFNDATPNSCSLTGSLTEQDAAASLDEPGTAHLDIACRREVRWREEDASSLWVVTRSMSVYATPQRLQSNQTI